MKRRHAIPVLALMTATVGCNDPSHVDGLATPSPEMPARTRQAKVANGMQPLGMAQEAAGAANADTNQGQESYWARQKLIRTAQIRLEVDRVAEAIGRVEELVEGHGGMLADSNRSRGDETWESAHLTLRVPSDELDALLAALREIGKVQHEGISTEDVTKAYFDLETRLSVKRQTESRLRELLATPGAELTDLIAVERELDRVVTEIERMLGEKRYYDERIAVSTVHVSLEERGAFVRPGALAPVMAALRESMHVLGRSLAGLISFLILALPWVVVAFAVWRGVRWVRRRRKRKSA